MKTPLALIIEDDESIRILFEAALEDIGFTIKIAVDGQAGLEALKTIVPDLIILDFSLPHLSGDTLLTHIRTDPRLKDAKVITVTANSAWAEQLRQESDLILLKPFSINQLQDLSKRLLNIA